MALPAVDWEQLTNVERTCLRVAFARWHASSAGSMPCVWPDGTPWYNDPLGPLFVAGIPAAKQQELEEVRLKGDSWMRTFCAVRTTEIDRQLQLAVEEAHAGQLVLIGAGMDTRAWRLQWPPGFSVFEVDTQQVLDFKRKMLHTASSSSSGSSAMGALAGVQLDADGVPVLSCERRVVVPADASKTEDMWSKLVAAGLSTSTPTIFLLEGFIGYLEREAGNSLLALLASQAAPGSRIIMTAPPTPAEQQARNQDAAEDAAIGDGGVRPYRPKLQHTTFEEPTETFARLVAAGWQDCQLLTRAELNKKYDVLKAQPILLGRS